MNSSIRLKVLLALQLCVGASFLACSGDDPPTDTDNGNVQGDGDGGDGDDGAEGGGTLALTYSPMYSAYVEGHESQVPVMLKDPSLRGKGAKFTSSDESIAVVTDTEQGGMITIKKEGAVTIKASLDGETGSAKLTITKYSEEQWMIGQARFSKSDLAIVPTMGGRVAITTLARDRAAYNPSGACNTCHTAQAKTLKIENTPTQIAGYSDSELITIFTEGEKPEGFPQKTDVPSFIWGMFHSWTVSEEEKDGLVAFLRTQAPKDNPAMVDYGVMPCAEQNGGRTEYCDSDGKPLRPPRADAGTDDDEETDAGTDAGSN
jgi:hypothetical protein